VDSGQLVGIIIGIIVVAAIIAAVLFFNRKRKADADRNRAAEMREKAKADELGAREREAKAARAEADAKQAEVDAERLRQEAREKQEEAARVRVASQEQLRKADELDPDVVTADRGADRDDENAPGQPQTRAEAGTRGRGDAAPDHNGAEEPPGERPRNL
jgi:FtsZ-interacting cell division protein ZipA